jgi:hypothetical protein
MHPEILRELTAQRNRELQARAHQAKLARAAAKIARMARRGHAAPGQADELVMPAIPDYVDGSFRAEPAGETAASQPGQAAAARHAA